MAVRKRGNCYQTVYRCPGEKSPRTELFKTEEEATLRDLQIKLRKKNGTFQPPAKTSKKQKTIITSNIINNLVTNFILITNY